MFTGLTPETDLAGLMHSLHDSATVFVLCTNFCFFQLARLPCLFLHRATCAKVICLFHVSGFLAYPTCFACYCALSVRKRERERTRLSGKKQKTDQSRERSGHSTWTDWSVGEWRQSWRKHAARQISHDCLPTVIKSTSGCPRTMSTAVKMAWTVQTAR